MSFISDAQLEEVRSRADVVQIIGERLPLKKAGRHFKGLCPFHQEKSPSFMVNPEKQIYHCFGCGEGGDVFSFLMKQDGLNFGEAVRLLADRYRITIAETGGEKPSAERSEKELLYRINRLATRFFYDHLESPAGARGQAYLEKRSIHREMWKEAYLGYAPNDGTAFVRKLNEKKVPLPLAEKLGLVRRGQGGYFDFFRDRLIFSIVSADGKFLGFSGRALSDEAQPKYLNSPESPIYHKSDTLLGIHLAKSAIRENNFVILVEGNFDLIRLHQEGLRCVVAPLGTALTERQVRYLRRFTEKFILLFDADAAGWKAAQRALDIFLPMGLSPRVLSLPQGEDPDSFVKSKGIEALRALIAPAPLLLEVQVEKILQAESRDTSGRIRAIQKITELLEKLPGEVEKSMYLQGVADKFGLPVEALATEMSKKSSRKRSSGPMPSNFSGQPGEQAKTSSAKPRKFPPLERTILEVLLSGHADPALLFREIRAEDFSDKALGRIWDLAQECHRQGGVLEVTTLVSRAGGEEEKKLLAELAFAGGRWSAEGGRVAEDCMKQLRTSRLRGRLQDLSQEIRRAQESRDVLKVKDLIDEKNRLIKQMSALH